MRGRERADDARWSRVEATTRPLTLGGSRLEINYHTGAAGSVRVELQDETGMPIPGRTLAECQEIIGDEIDCVVIWWDGSDLSALAGRSLRLRFLLREADLFSLRFCDCPRGELRTGFAATGSRCGDVPGAIRGRSWNPRRPLVLLAPWHSRPRRVRE